MSPTTPCSRRCIETPRTLVMGLISWRWSIEPDVPRHPAGIVSLQSGTYLLIDIAGPMCRRGSSTDWGAAAVRSAAPATNNPFASPDVPETAPVDGFGESAFGAAAAPGGASGDGGFGESAFGEQPAFGAASPPCMQLRTCSS